jgi:hypothetical protein
VFLAADDFNEHGDGECPDGWGDCGGDFEIATDANSRALYSGANDLYLMAGDAGWGDILIAARVRADDPDTCPGIAARVEDTDNLVYAGYNCATGGMPATNVAVWPRISGGYTPLVWGDVDPGTGYHRVVMAWTGDMVRLRYDDQLVDAGTAPPDVAATGRVGVFSSYGGDSYVDDVVVRRFVDPEPEVTAGPAEPFAG